MPFFKAFFFWPSGKTQGAESGSQLRNGSFQIPLIQQQQPGQVQNGDDRIPKGVAFQGRVLDSKSVKVWAFFLLRPGSDRYLQGKQTVETISLELMRKTHFHSALNSKTWHLKSLSK